MIYENMELIRPVHIAMNVHSEMETVVYKSAKSLVNSGLFYP